jgi:hypothetical protein
MEARSRDTKKSAGVRTSRVKVRRGGMKKMGESEE